MKAVILAGGFGSRLSEETVRTVLVVTSDKVYANDGGARAFRESDPLGGADPYSNSKACTELVCRSYAKSFLRERGVVLATARAGNVIGGGGWAKDRLVPDFIRALERGTPVQLRYPEAVRPWQHVLEPLGGYLAYAQALTDGGAEALPDALNFGPDPQDFATVAEELGHGFGISHAWERAPGECVRRLMGWTPPDGIYVPRWVLKNTYKKKASMAEVTTIGLDIAKNVFQVHGADAAGHQVFRVWCQRSILPWVWGCSGAPRT